MCVFGIIYIPNTYMKALTYRMCVYTIQYTFIICDAIIFLSMFFTSNIITSKEAKKKKKKMEGKRRNHNHSNDKK